MKFWNTTLCTLLALLISQLLGLNIASALPSESKLVQRAGSSSSSASPWYLKNVPGATTPQNYLKVDVLNVGYVLQDGRFKISSLQLPKREAIGSGNSALIAQDRRIGTETLAVCSVVMLISQRGTLMVHLNPDTCELFLNPARTPAQVAADKKRPEYKALEKAFNEFRAETQKYFQEYQQAVGQTFMAAMVRGPQQNSNQYGLWILQKLFNIRSQPSIYFLQRK